MIKMHILIPACVAGVLLTAFISPKKTSKVETPTASVNTPIQSTRGSFTTLHKKLSTRRGRDEVRIHDAGARFIKVQLEALKLQPGQFVSITNPDGTEQHRYQSEDLAQMNKKSLLSISGDTAILRIKGPSSWYQAGSLQVAGYWRDDPATIVPFSTCGSSQRERVACYANSDPEAVRRSQPVAKLWAGSLQCTAWRVGAGNRFLTNNHCMSLPSTAADAELWFDYEHVDCQGSSLKPTVKVPVKRILKTNFELDYTLFEVEDFDLVAEYGYLGIDLDTVVEGQRIFIPQHGDGDPKQLAINSDQNAGGYCAIDSASTTGNAADTDMGYLCDTLGGSSGSPVLRHGSSEAIALHHFGGCENKGVKMALIWPQIQTFFHDQRPTSDNGFRLDNRLPVLDFNVESVQLNAEINNTSVDPDGDIVSHKWYLDENLFSEDTNPSLQLEKTGTYTVGYSVIDNDDAPQYIERDMTVLERRQNGQVILGNGSKVVVTQQLNDTVFVLDVPQSAVNLSIRLEGRAASLAVRKNSPPTRFRKDCSVTRRITKKECFFSDVAAGEYYVQVTDVSSEPATLMVEYSLAGSGFVKRWEQLEGREGDWQYFKIDVPPGMATLQVETRGGSGDLDLYVQEGSLPERNYWRCLSDGWDNDERCRISRPRAGKWYIGLRGSWDFEGVEMIATARP